MKELDFIYQRKSIRKFKPDAVPQTHIDALIQAATQAPSGKNSQNWHFVVVKNKNIIQKIATGITSKNAEFCAFTQDESLISKFSSQLNSQTLFKDAPVLILVYASSYPIISAKLLKDKPATSEEMHRLLRHSPGIQNIGAAMENLLLSAAALGYGTCWMTAPVFAEDAINDAIGFDNDDFYLTCLTPLGIPADDSSPQPHRKALKDVMTVIE